MKMMNLKVTVALIMAASFAHADVFTWSGGGADNGWLTDQNWSSGLAPADNGTASLTFSGSTRLSPDNDFVADTVFAAIRFSNNGSTGKKSAFSLSGNRLTLGGDITTIESSAAITDTAALDMTLSASRTITANKLHHLTITGNV